MDLKCRRQQKLHSVDENKLVGTIRVEGISPVVIWPASRLTTCASSGKILAAEQEQK